VHRVAGCIRDRIRPVIPQATEGQRIGDQNRRRDDLYEAGLRKGVVS
jgi:hypothetical protein